MNFQLIVTLGPSILNEDLLRQIHSLGRCIYRINGAHSDAKEARELHSCVKSILNDAEIMLDLPGNKIRTARTLTPVELKRNHKFSLAPSDINFSMFHEYLKPGDVVFACDSTVKLEVDSIEEGVICFVSHSDGLLNPGKGLHVKNIHQDIPFLFELDRDLINLACVLKMEYLSLSFVRNAEDVREVKQILRSKQNSETKIISKIETSSAVENLGYIFHEVDLINIDRGDLSTDVGLLKLPIVQERVVSSAKRANKKVFLATQFLKNMEEQPIPLIAELIDLYKTIEGGIDGIQLSEETAIGKYPVQCVKQVFDIYNASFSF